MVFSKEGVALGPQVTVGRDGALQKAVAKQLHSARLKYNQALKPLADEGTGPLAGQAEEFIARRLVERFTEVLFSSERLRTEPLSAFDADDVLVRALSLEIFAARQEWNEAIKPLVPEGHYLLSRPGEVYIARELARALKNAMISGLKG